MGGALSAGAAARSESEATLEGLRKACSLLRNHVLAPTEALFGRPWEAVLWSPGPDLRQLPPRLLWPAAAVATTTALTLPAAEAPPRRRTGTLLVLADGRHPGVPHLGAHGVRALQRLSHAADSRGPVGVLRGPGEADVAAPVLGLPTVARLTGEAGRHDVVAVIAHGRSEAEDGGALLLLDESGEPEWVGVDALSRHSHRFDGCVVVLLSCSTGAAGAAAAEHAGVAGTLLAAGAVTVVAPLWPVSLDAAVRTAEAVMSAIAAGLDPWEGVTACSELGDSGIRLGRPPTSSTTRAAASRLDELAWVTWVG